MPPGLIPLMNGIQVPQVSPILQQTRQPPQRRGGRFDGILALLGADPRQLSQLGASPEGLGRAALLGAGTGLLEAAQPSPVPISTGQALLQAIQGAQRGVQGKASQNLAMAQALGEQKAAERQQIAEQRRRAQLIGALPEQDRRAAQGLSTEALEEIVSAQFEGRKPVSLGRGDRLVDPQTGKEIVGPLEEEEVPDLGVQTRAAMAMAGFDPSGDLFSLPPEDRAAVRAMREALDQAGADRISVGPLGPSFDSEIGRQTAGLIFEKRAIAEDAARDNANINQLLAELESDRDLLLGPEQTVARRVVPLLAAAGLAPADSEDALAATQSFLARANQGTLSVLKAFTGNKTEKELEEARRIAGAEASLKPEAIADVLRARKTANEVLIQEFNDMLSRIDRGENVSLQELLQLEQQARQFQLAPNAPAGGMAGSRFNQIIQEMSGG